MSKNKINIPMPPSYAGRASIKQARYNRDYFAKSKGITDCTIEHSIKTIKEALEKSRK